jgi:hypothetical protein
MSCGYGVFCGQMSSQVIYQTNADWHDSYDALAKNTLVTVEQTKKGLLWFHFKESQTVFILSPTGKLQVKWRDLHEKRILYKQIKNLLVAKPDEKLTIKPLKQQMWIEYPVPESFKIYWCDHSNEFVLKKPSGSKTEEAPNEQQHSEQEKGSLIHYRNEAAAVKKALEELRHEFRLFREPTLNEVALKSGCFTDSRYMKDYLFLAGWKPPRLNDIDYVKSLAEQTINLAAWLRFKSSGELNPKLITRYKRAIDSATISTIGSAQEILKKYPGIVPEINETELKWPDEAKKKWIEVFGCEPPASAGNDP